MFKRPGSKSGQDNSAEIFKKYSRDLTELARNGQIDPVIGRDEEVEKVITTLSRRTKNNPLLIGEPGVGKTAIAEGLALKIANSEAPALRNKTIVALDMGAMVSGTQYRGDFENRMRALLDEFRGRDDVICFIDEIHTVLGAGGTAEGTMDAANILKPALARGEINCIGATTLEEYRLIEKDKALERRFQKIMVDEPSPEETLQILKGLKERYEAHHGVKYDDEALEAIIPLTKRYMAERFYPDKAIDVMDEAGALLAMRRSDVSGAFLNKQARFVQDLDKLEEELSHFKRMRDFKRKQKETLENNLQEEQDKIAQIKARLSQYEKKQSLTAPERQDKSSLIFNLKVARSGLVSARQQIEKMTLEYQHVEDIASLQADKKALNDKIESLQDRAGTQSTVDRSLVENTVEKLTGIPVSLTDDEKHKALNAVQAMKENIIGQDHALETLGKVLMRRTSKLSDPDRPSSFLFAGSTGVGKTETAKVLSRYIFDRTPGERTDNLIRIDMSEYMDRMSVSRLIGSPPGYVGHEEGGQLTEKVRRKPYSVVLLDEIEKAHPEIFNVLLQVLDDGQLTDGTGRTVDFSNTIVIMTSNYGTSAAAESDLGGLGFGASNESQDIDPTVYEEAIRTAITGPDSIFPDEFLNRIDDVIVFNRLTDTHKKQIADKLLNDLARRVDDNLNLKLSWSEAVRDDIADKGVSREYGAREMQRVIKNTIESDLSDELLRQPERAEQSSGVRIDMAESDADNQTLSFTFFKALEATEDHYQQTSDNDSDVRLQDDSANDNIDRRRPSGGQQSASL